MANPKSKKRKKLLVFSLILLALIGLTGVAVLKKKEPIITVQKEKVSRRNLTELVVANGKVQPVVQVKISPEVSGEITDLPVKEGQCVKKGDLLVKIKPDNYTASRNSADANYKYSVANSNTAWANLQKAELEYQRNESLFKTKLISDSAFLEAKTTYDVAKANLVGSIQQVEMAHASLQKAEDDLSKTTIYSPLDGTITKLNSQLGERVVGTAMMAGTEIMTVSDLNAMETRVDIGEIDVVLIQVGQKARLDVDAFKDRKFNGTVTDIANSSKNSSNATSSSSTEATKFEVKIRIDEKEQFRPGMSVTAEIETRYRTNVITVPIQSVTTRFPKGTPTNSVALGKDDAHAANSSVNSSTPAAEKKKLAEAPKPSEVVFLVDGERAKMVPVKRGISDDNYVEITEGLKEDQQVVSGGYKAINRELEEGKQIKASEAKPEGGAEKK
ncbi:efflux RND transporter periplasmic adaptor subunit [Pedosphaera parvula]|uniref:Efflux transporter, RND family, MFP subunit n=1 Tax=Pedosphaera parvula (strain Ellin514) TaxID=320771 RepID=B9XA84_PEDPL|nr:efflux RND transporter periplasmic adaptor subunit [Pedosphaera parvula]EEF63425.1 efflux transporter, RND family, MFP subunit [Pedosphaera parvula Ellin514]